MTIQAKFVHVNLIARDWRKLAAFYRDVFGCRPVPPERDQAGDWLAKGTGAPGAALQGVHLRLPGWPDDGPTLELYQYRESAPALEPLPNRPGYGHIAFAVEDVDAALAAMLAAGGSSLGEPVSVTVAGAGELRFVYARDPEGNIVELQAWAR